MEPRFETPGTIGHPMARTPDDQLARSIYYSMTATDTERMLAEKLMEAIDWVEGADAEIEEAQNDANLAETRAESWKEDFEELARKTGEEIIAESNELKATIAGLRAQIRDRDAALGKLKYRIEAAHRQKRKTLKVEDLLRDSRGE